MSDFSYCRKNEYKTSLQEKTVAIFMEKEICVQKVKDKKKEIKKKTIKTEKFGACKPWEALFMKIIHHCFAATLPVAHTPARG